MFGTDTDRFCVCPFSTVSFAQAPVTVLPTPRMHTRPDTTSFALPYDLEYVNVPLE